MEQTGRMDNVFDIAIIGSGPAGCAAALYCELHGLATCLITGMSSHVASHPNLPSQSVHPGIESLFELLKLPLKLENIAFGCYEGIYFNDNYTSLGQDETSVWKGYHLSKEKLVQVMLKAISNKAIKTINDIATELTETDGKVTGIITKDNVRIKADNILDCSGSSRFATRKLNIQRKVYSPSFICWSSRTDSIPAAIHENLKTSLIMLNGSWEWLAPEYNNTCTWTRLLENGKPNLSPPQVLRNFNNDPKVSVFNMRWSMSRPVIASGLLICGDAGAIVDPSAGQGIFFAVYSAIMAGHVLVRSIQEPEMKRQFFEEYDQWFFENTEKKLRELKDIYLTNGFKW
jgi:flavin-dependent dehydrogenase